MSFFQKRKLKFLNLFPIFICFFLNVHDQAFCQWQLEIDDPLTNGKTIGTRSGGVFTAEGWKTTGRYDNIKYYIETCPYGRIEFDVVGIYGSNEVFDNIGYNKYGEEFRNLHYSLFNMWDRDPYYDWFGTRQWHNPYKVFMHLFGYTYGDRWKWKHGRFRANISAYSGGYDNDPHAFEVEYGPIDWQKTHVYHMKLEWGEGHMSYYIDGHLIVDCDYSAFGAEYAPPYHTMSLGSAHNPKADGFQVPRFITFSNFKFYRNSDITPPEIVRYSPSNGETELEPDPYISIVFDAPIDFETAKSAFTITPSVPGQLRVDGNAVYYKLSSLLEPQTTYTVTIDTALTDKSGNHLQQLFSYQFTTGDYIPQTVKKYEIFEIPILAPGITTNKYTNVTLKGVFQGPTKTIEIDGFWDGGDLWKVRMAPTEVGTWTYEITSNYAQLNKTGSFQCTPSEHKGFIRKNPDHPYTLMWDDGTPFMWKGETSWRGMTASIPFESRWKEYIDLRAEQGYNAVQCILVSYINGDFFWKNEGGHVFVTSTAGKDYDRLNPGYFQWVDRRIEYALSKGIVPVLFFTWAQEFIKFSREQFDRYSKYLIARYAGYNVVWCVCGEYNETYVEFGTSPNVWKHHGSVVHNTDPYGHITCLHPTGRTTSNEFGGTEWMDIIMEQSPYWHRDILRDRIYRKPVVNGEYGYAGWNPDPDIRIGAWEIITAGGFFTAGFFKTFAPDKGGWDPSANQQQQDELAFLFSFMKDTEWWKMHPMDSKVSNGYCLANPGKEYIIYSRNGGATDVDLSDVTGTIPVEWLNPREFTYSGQTEIQGGSTVSLTPPFEGDWVLHIGEGAPQDSLPPNPPKNLVMSDRTMHSISLAWAEPDVALDGDIAESYKIYRNDNHIATVSETHYRDYGLLGDTSYQYSVYSVDESRNTSLQPVTGSFSTLADNEPPIIQLVNLASKTEIMVKFDEKIDRTTAENTANYAIEPEIQINAANLMNDLSTVKLQTEPHQEAVFYTLIVNNIIDLAKNPNTIEPNTKTSYRYAPPLSVTQISEPTYKIDTLKVGMKYYIDRPYTITNLPPELNNLLFLQTANDDKSATNFPFITFNINRSAKIYIAYQTGKPLPTWMQEGWTDNGKIIQTTDDTTLSIYEKAFNAGKVELGANFGDGSSSMYLVIFELLTNGDTTPPSPPVGLVVNPL